MSSIDPIDIIWRDSVAKDHLGTVVTHTSAVFRTSDTNVVGQGWLYIGKEALAWISDKPVFGSTNEDRIVFATYADIGWSVRLKRHRLSRTATVWFGKGSSFLGGIRQMDMLFRLGRNGSTRG